MKLLHVYRQLPEEDELQDDIVEALRKIRDPEIPVNIYDLGLIYGMEIGEDGQVFIRMTLTTPNCPMAQSFPSQVAAMIEQVPGVSKVHIELVWEPRWDVSRVSEAARLDLGLM
jgi:FeS assembly SUF system protein